MKRKLPMGGTKLPTVVFHVSSVFTFAFRSPSMSVSWFQKGPRRELVQASQN
jgi:hypothetical protein